MPHLAIPFQVRTTVFALTFCIIVLEISYTRVFAWIFHHHFAFFSVSLGMCGLGLGGYLTHLLSSRCNETQESKRVFWCTLAFPILTCTAILVSIQWIAINFPGSYFAIGATLLLPFPLAGAALAALFQRYSERSGRLYAVDLAGAAVAAVAAVVLLNALTAIDTILLACSLAALCPLLLLAPGWRQQAAKPRYLACTCLAFCFSLLVANLALGVFNFPFTADGRMTVSHFRAVADVEREMSRFRRESEERPESVVSHIFREMAGGQNKARLLHTEWSAFGRTDVLFKPRYPEELEIWLNGESPAFMLRFDGDYGVLEKWKSRIGFLPYQIRDIKDVLSLGSGAGMDVHLARLGGAQSIDAVEINPAMSKVLTEFQSFGGGVYEQPGVEFHQSEGRVFVKQSQKKYDLIVSALTVMSKGSAGAMVESYVSTLEAALDYYDHLTEEGMVAYFISSPLSAERWFVTCLDALVKKLNRSHTDALSHLSILTSPRAPFNYLVLMSRAPFSADELDVMEEFASRFGRGKAVIPGRMETSQVKRLRDTGSYPTSYATRHGRIDISPATDDKPFFNDVHVSLPRALEEMLYLALVIAAVFGASAALQINRAKAGVRGSSTDHRWLALWTIYFAPLGAGFMLIEIGLIQAFILLTGSPTHTVALVLLALLSGCALGSYFSQGLATDDLAKYPAYIALAVAGAALVLSQSPDLISDALLGTTLSIRVLSMFLICAVLGAPMGALFPTGLRLIARDGNEWVPYFWGVNGVASVVGSVLAAIGGKYIGFSGVMLVAASIYVLAAICLNLGRYHPSISRSRRKVSRVALG
jgi:hypothetical protein